MRSGRLVECELQTLKTNSIDLQLQFVAMSMKVAITSTNTMLTTANFMAQHSIWCAISVYMVPNGNELQFIRILFSLLPSQQGRQQWTFTTQTSSTKNIHVRRKSMLCMRCDHNETISLTKPIFKRNHLIRYICLHYTFLHIVPLRPCGHGHGHEEEDANEEEEKEIHFQHLSVGIA